MAAAEENRPYGDVRLADIISLIGKRKLPCSVLLFPLLTCLLRPTAVYRAVISSGGALSNPTSCCHIKCVAVLLPS